MADAGVNHYTFHVEATDDPAKCIRVIREADMKVNNFEMLSTENYFDPIKQSMF